ncbi:MAG: AraC family transcriptional regulator [Pseudomonadota bacterium]
MEFGEQDVLLVDSLSSLDLSSPEMLEALKAEGVRVTKFSDTSDEDYYELPALDQFRSPGDNFYVLKVNKDCVIEVNDVRVDSSLLVRNRVGDILSLQFVSKISRSEILGDVTLEQNLGPAIICTAVPGSLLSYRVPKQGEKAQYVAVHTTLSDLFERLGEDIDAYPSWLRECVKGRSADPVQRVLFYDSSHRNLIWPCFYPPVEGSLRKKWLTGKFWELLTVGLQSMKEDVHHEDGRILEASASDTDLLKRARRVIDREYADPPSLEELASKLGLSQTRLKSGFKLMFGSTVMQYCLQKRVDAARLLLVEPHLSISQIAFNVGYEDPSAFSRAYRRVTGQSPQEWRQMARGEESS